MRDGKADLRLDRRLAHRRGWIGAAELEKELSALADVADKAELVNLPGTPSDEESEAPGPEGGPGLH